MLDDCYSLKNRSAKGEIVEGMAPPPHNHSCFSMAKP